jgi:RHH-type transcriptional regulator, rel operon repressor / antitoxin RelB
MASVSVRIPDDLKVRLDRLATITGRGKSFYMLEAIRQHLDDLEDLYEAHKVSQDIKSGKTQTIPLTEVMKEYGMDC